MNPLINFVFFKSRASSLARDQDFPRLILLVFKFLVYADHCVVLTADHHIRLIFWHPREINFFSYGIGDAAPTVTQYRLPDDRLNRNVHYNPFITNQMTLQAIFRLEANRGMIQILLNIQLILNVHHFGSFHFIIYHEGK